MLILTIRCNTTDCMNSLESEEIHHSGDHVPYLEEIVQGLRRVAGRGGWHSYRDDDRCPRCVELDTISRLDRASHAGM